MDSSLKKKRAGDKRREETYPQVMQNQSGRLCGGHPTEFLGEVALRNPTLPQDHVGGRLPWKSPVSTRITHQGGST